jgi:hypothetical protein
VNLPNGPDPEQTAVWQIFSFGDRNSREAMNYFKLK